MPRECRGASLALRGAQATKHSSRGSIVDYFASAFALRATANESLAMTVEALFDMCRSTDHSPRARSATATLALRAKGPSCEARRMERNPCVRNGPEAGWRRGSPPRNERNAHFIGIGSTHLLATYTYTYTSQGSFPRAVEDQRYSSAIFQSFSSSIFFPKMELPSSIFGKSALASAHAGCRHGHC